VDPDGATRRELIRVGLTAGAAAAGSLALTAGGVAAATTTDSDLLVLILGAELLAQFAYERVLASHLMPASDQRLATKMLVQEREHTRRLAAELRLLGRTPPARITSVTDADEVLVAHGIPNRLSQLRSKRDCITVLVRVETLLEGAYFKAIPKLSDPRLVTLSAQVMACESQHFAVLNELLRPGNLEKAVPSPYVQGYF